MKKTTKNYIATFTNELLGSKPNDAEVHKTFIGQKEGKLMKDELTAEEKTLNKIDTLEKGRTIFHRDDDGTPIIWNYQILGFLKEAFGALARNKENACAKIKAYKKVIDTCVFVSPRKIRLELPEDSEIGVCERPLRAETMQGPRVALASSDEVPACTKMRFSITTLVDNLDDAIAECWEYAQLHGMGQWRNSGRGTFFVTEDNSEK